MAVFMSPEIIIELDGLNFCNISGSTFFQSEMFPNGIGTGRWCHGGSQSEGAEKPKAESSTVIATGWVVDYIQSAPGHHRPDRFLVVVSANWGINQAVAVT